MEKIIVPVYEMKTLADVINAIPIPKWKKKALTWLIPSEFHQYAPQTMVDALPKGIRIASMQIMYDVLDTSLEPVNLTVGE